MQFGLISQPASGLSQHLREFHAESSIPIVQAMRFQLDETVAPLIVPAQKRSQTGCSERAEP